jgi:ABC-type cobalamin transport system permease subunit
MEKNFPQGTLRIRSTYRHAIRVGLATGVLMVALVSAWLLIANRAPNYEQYAATRNIVAGILGLIVAVIPVVKFARSPRAVLLSGVIAWALLCACYFTWTFYFDELDRENTLRLFMMGAVVYGFVAALAWLGRALLAARERRERHLSHVSHASHHTLNHS